MSKPNITPLTNGPFHVKGQFTITEPGGYELKVEKEEAWLCRCGDSAKKPFCDGAHKASGFKAST